MIALDYLITDLRLRIGDTASPYRYLDIWLKKALILASKTLYRYWGNKYLVDDNGVVTRNPNTPLAFIFEEDYGVIEKRDEAIIVLTAAIIVLEGSLENSAWDAVSWKDNEISFSNLERYRSRGDTIKRLVDELNSLVLPPTKKLARPRKSSLPGFTGNRYEKTTKY